MANGGIIALCVWFGEGDFLKTVNLAIRAADFTDADCNAAGAAAVVGAMRGIKAIPPHLLAALHDRVAGDKMGDLPLPPVDEKISALGSRTAAFGEKMLLSHGAKLEGEALLIPRETPQALPPERFTLADLTQFWAPDWTLERAGFGATTGGKGNYPGGTWLTGDVLTTWPREMMRGVVLRRKLTLPDKKPHLTLEVAADAGRAWELVIQLDNAEVQKQAVIGGGAGLNWQKIDVDLSAGAGREATVRLYQNILSNNRLRAPSVAHWRAPQIIVQPKAPAKAVEGEKP